MVNTVYDLVVKVYDPLHVYWERPSTQRKVAVGFIASFLLSLCVIELNRQGVLPPPLAQLVPMSHFHAVNLAFNLVLGLEILGLIFVLPSSVSSSLGKQFEILCLIFIANAFMELINFSEPINVAGNEQPLQYILAFSLGGLVVFALLGLYYRIQRHKETLRSGVDRYHFVSAKKLVALCLLAGFAGLGLDSLWSIFLGQKRYEFFASFYTMLIFCDILIVLISLRYMPAFHAVFRNSGYTLCTLIIRLSMTAPPYVAVALGVSAAVLAVCLTLAYNAFAPHMDKGFGSYKPCNREVCEFD